MGSPLLALSCCLRRSDPVSLIVGIPYMWTVLRIGGVSMSWTEALNAGLTPFIIGGIIKAAAGAAVVGGLWKAMGSGNVSRS